MEVVSQGEDSLKRRSLADPTDRRQMDLVEIRNPFCDG
jgi:hypothetical protein